MWLVSGANAVFMDLRLIKLAVIAAICGLTTYAPEASAQAWWSSNQHGPPAVEDGRPVPSIATSLPDNGDPGGYRKWLGERGVVYGLEYTNDVLANVHGGLRTGAIDQGKVQGILTVDFEKLAGWNGLSFFTNFFQIHNTGPYPARLCRWSQHDRGHRGGLLDPAFRNLAPAELREQQRKFQGRPTRGRQ